MDGIKGAIAVVTGAAQGNGEAIAKGLAQNGAKVALADVQIDIAETVAAAIRMTQAARLWRCPLMWPSSPPQQNWLRRCGKLSDPLKS